MAKSRVIQADSHVMLAGPATVVVEHRHLLDPLPYR